VFDGCDVIALVTHGREGLRRWVMGNVTAQVLRDSKLPLLIVPSQWRGDMGEEEQEVESENRAVFA
jgi:hypothetical protein